MQSYDYTQREGIEEVSWEQFAQLVATLAEKLVRVETVIGIARTGSWSPSVSPPPYFISTEVTQPFSNP